MCDELMCLLYNHAWHPSHHATPHPHAPTKAELYSLTSTHLHTEFTNEYTFTCPTACVSHLGHRRVFTPWPRSIPWISAVRITHITISSWALFLYYPQTTALLLLLLLLLNFIRNSPCVLRNIVKLLSYALILLSLANNVCTPMRLLNCYTSLSRVSLA